MKANWKQMFVMLVGAFSVCGMQAQGTFQNLNFELATVPLSEPASPPGEPTVDVAVALPGWSVFIGSIQVAEVMYNSQTLDTSAVALFRDNRPAQYPFLNVIEGSFSVFLLGGYVNSIPTDTSLSQTGLIPIEARSIQFKTSSQIGVNRPIVVSIDGQPLSSVPLEVTPEYILRGADVALFSGQIKELRFTIFAPTDGGGGIPGILDSITFSAEPVPEPAVFGLFALGALLLGRQALCKRINAG